MIGYIKGRILESLTDSAEASSHPGVSGGQAIVGNTKILVALEGHVESQGAIGYEISVPWAPQYFSLLSNESSEFYIHTHVREDQLELFGFLSKAEKKLFRILLSASGIGPKAALSIISNSKLENVIRALSQGDKEFLAGIKGIGKKTAEKLAIDLKEKVNKEFSAVQLSTSSVGSSDSGVVFESESFRDSKSALVSLGYREKDASEVLEKVYQRNPGIQSVEDAVREALKEI